MIRRKGYKSEMGFTDWDCKEEERIEVKGGKKGGRERRIKTKL